MSEHTPGPWVWSKKGEIGPVSKEDNQTFGMIFPVAYLEEYNWPENNEANARLIASAPEMLAALEELMDIEGPQPGTSAWADKTRALIAKAKGEV